MLANPPLKLVVLLSGTGTTLQALIDAIADHTLHAKIHGVISNRPEVQGLQRAKTAHIPTQTLQKKQFETRAEYDQALIDAIEAHEPDWIVLAGFMEILSPAVVDTFPNHILNIHPSLLPKYRGLHTYQRVLEAGDAEHGSTVHIVNHDLDAGLVLAQSVFPIPDDATLESLKAHTQALEHILYPQVIQWLSEKRMRIDHTSVYFEDNCLPACGKTLHFPCP